jgi:uncharacterized protein
MAYKQEYIIENLKKLNRLLKNNNIKLKKIILFGSYAKHSENEESDVDVALVSDDFSGIRFLDIEKIASCLIKIDPIIEVHPFKTEDFNKDNDFFVQEIISTGSEISLTTDNKIMQLHAT